MATGTSEGVIQVWDMKTQTNVTNFAEHSQAVRSIAFSENGYYMASGANDGVVKVWDLRNGMCLKSLEMGSEVSAVQFDYSGMYLSVGSNQLDVFDSKSWEKRFECTEDVGGYHCLAFGDKAKYLLAGCGNRSISRFSLWCVCYKE